LSSLLVVQVLLVQVLVLLVVHVLLVQVLVLVQVVLVTSITQSLLVRGLTGIPTPTRSHSQYQYDPGSVPLQRCTDD
jgi:hypothetical protein